MELSSDARNFSGAVANHFKYPNYALSDYDI